jgi:hypothetical protein
LDFTNVLIFPRGELNFWKNNFANRALIHTIGLLGVALKKIFRKAKRLGEGVEGWCLIHKAHLRF